MTLATRGEQKYTPILMVDTYLPINMTLEDGTSHGVAWRGEENSIRNSSRKIFRNKNCIAKLQCNLQIQFRQIPPATPQIQQTLFQIPHHPCEELSNTTYMSQFLTTKVKHHVPLQKFLWYPFDQDQASTALNQTHIMVFQTLIEMASKDSFLQRIYPKIATLFI